MIFASGRPRLLLPQDWPVERIAQRIVVGWNGSREAARAIADALPLLRAAQQVALVVVPGAKGIWGEEAGADMAAHLARHGVPVSLHRLPDEEAGTALLARCATIDADLLVMCAKGRADIGQFLFGGATRAVLDAAQVPLLLSG